jgi:hypothetical protein
VILGLLPMTDAQSGNGAFVEGDGAGAGGRLWL